VKLRIRDNSVRLRLTRGEVETLRSEGIVSARTGFPGGHNFHYVIESSPASVSPGAFFAANTMTVRLPESTVLAWAATDQVSIEGEQLLNDGEKTTILVEKDFVCLTPREGEDESEMFPHPEKGSGEGTC